MTNDNREDMNVESIVESAFCNFCHEKFKDGDKITQLITGNYTTITNFIDELPEEKGIKTKSSECSEMHTTCFNLMYKLSLNN